MTEALIAGGAGTVIAWTFTSWGEHRGRDVYSATVGRFVLNVIGAQAAANAGRWRWLVLFPGECGHHDEHLLDDGMEESVEAACMAAVRWCQDVSDGVADALKLAPQGINAPGVMGDVAGQR